MFRLTLFSLLFLISNLVWGQAFLMGKVQQTDNQAIPFVNIGIKGKNLGTTSDLEGNFKFALNSTIMNDTLTFSCVGFQSVLLPISSLQPDKVNVIVLSEKIKELNEVVVTTKKMRIKKVGTKSYNPLVWGSVESTDTRDILEVGKTIKVKKPSEVLKASIYLRGVNIDTATFRVNFYKIQDDLPADRLIEQNILVRQKIKDGWLHIDLSPYQIYVKEDFFVSLEFLPQAQTEKISFYYGATMAGSSLSRTVSLGSWEKFVGASLSMYVTLRN